MEEQVENRSKRKLDIDWGQVLPERSDDQPSELIVEKVVAPPSANSDESASGDEIDNKLSDCELEQNINRMRVTYDTLRLTLPDKGEKLIRTIKRLEGELERRRHFRAELVCLDVDGCEKPTQSFISGASDAYRPGTASSQFQSRSSFASAFTEKMEEKKNYRAFDKELSTLAPCEGWKIKSNEELSHVGRQKSRSSIRQRPFKCGSSLSSNGDKSIFSSDELKDKAPSTHLAHHAVENISSSFPMKKDESQFLPSNKLRQRKERTLVLIDEDEYPLGKTPEKTLHVETQEKTLHVETPEKTSHVETPEKTLHVETTEQEDKLDERMKDVKIYYPSRDDPESVEICYMDINHLSPGAYLTSPIMNFYIRYLQQQASPTNRAIYDCHFFNTYFYMKLKEAVSYKGGDKNSFIKFRRWWKGVNIFQKAYVLIPIHEDLHWSLVIISIPNKKEESGPIILHLDSLGLHSSRLVFHNIRSFLKEEWNYLNEKVSLSNLPIADRIWKHLPRRIDEKVITVPQQKNDYDCGLFVLFFMERFIEEAPERLKKEDLAMFGKRWFKPEEASGLRLKIRNLLKEEFELAKEGCCISKPPWSSGRTET